MIAGGAKSAAVPHPDGSHRLLYCMESPESWFEDFGVGTISGGKAEVKLDPDFAAVVDTAKLHVFTESHDEHHALHVAKTDATGFTVGVNPSAVGLAAGKKAGDLNGTFTYRVVAKRKDVAAPRLAKFEVPKTPAPAPTREEITCPVTRAIHHAKAKEAIDRVRGTVFSAHRSFGSAYQICSSSYVLSILVTPAADGGEMGDTARVEARAHAGAHWRETRGGRHERRHGGPYRPQGADARHL